MLTLMTAATMLALTGGIALAAVLEGNNGDNRLFGTERADEIRGFGGDDFIRSLGGGDTVTGGSGDDTIYGGDGRDRLFGGNGFDQISAGDGNDYVSVIGDDSGDFVNCGPGKDSVDVMFGQPHGPKDVYKNCEIFAQ
jgi:Ca2+-binding RTX toxin-like protein